VTADVLVVGAGVMGAATALFLARRGLSVALVDRGGLCAAASGVNAGTLTLHMTRAALIRHAMRGHALWTGATADGRDWLGHTVGATATPGLCLAYTDAEAELLERRAAVRQEAGAPIELVSAPRAHSIEPGLGGVIKLAAYCPVDGHVTAYRTANAARAALAAAGVQLHEWTPIRGIDRRGGAFEGHGDGVAITGRQLVLAGGVWLEEMLGWLGLHVPIKVLVNQLAVTDKRPAVMRSVVTIASGLLSLKQFASGAVVIGGGWQGRGDRQRGGAEIVPERLVGNVRLAAWTIPALCEATVMRTWLGLEAETADAMPILGPVPGVDGAFAIGSVHSGYTSGPAMGEIMASLVLGEQPGLPHFPFERLIVERTALASAT
jgi:sarcosine oxidase subunit beta